jgi:uncharacterized repeat protein (TIGR03833 family)
MQRQRNRQRRSRRGGGGNNEEYASNVPTIDQVVAGAFVSIVLKVDQPTGAQVQGVVGRVLTNGNHPRGIKVMLQDGRVGRVQKMISDETAPAAAQGLNELGRNGEHAGQVRSSRYTNDLTLDEEYGLPTPSSAHTIGDYFVGLETKHKSSSSGNNVRPISNNFDTDADMEGESADFMSADITCPVCGAFQGDEAAVARHVNMHFET